MSDDRIYITVRDKGRLVRADYTPYGPYIELTFGQTNYKPTEVINVWDYKRDESEMKQAVDVLRNNPMVKIGPSTVRHVVRLAVKRWIHALDKEWPEWYEGYLLLEEYGVP